MQHASDENATLPKQTLGVFLKSLRRRIDRRAEYLGDFARLQTRLGHAVSQEEVAEALQVSRGWYCLLESGGKIRASTKLVARIADTLMLSAEERVQLFALALPEVAPPQSALGVSTELKTNACQMLEAYTSLRELGRKLWAATTPLEALAVANEHMSVQFRADVTQSVARVGDCSWSLPYTIGRPHKTRTLDRIDAFVRANCEPVRQDELRFYADLLTRPGDVLARDDIPRNFGIQEKFGAAIEHAGWHDLDFLAASVRSREGFAGVISMVDEHSRGYTEVEREHLSTIAQLVSHAL